MEFGFPTQQSKGGYQSWQSEKVIAMQMRYEDMLNSGELDFTFSKHYLRTLSTINQEEMVPYFEYLGGRVR